MNPSKILSIGFVLSLLAPVAVSAHEHQTFEIGNKTYDFTIGSQNEPVSVDDKSGVELSIWTAGEGGVAVDGLEKTLKVELQADGQKKMMDLSATWGEPGGYYATFYPTVETSYSYRVVGTMNDVPVDLLFTCSPAGHEMHVTEPDTSRVKISENVTRTNKGGRFGCPKAKDILGFPAKATTLRSLEKRANFSLLIGLVGLALGATAMVRTGKRA